jgi:hypothetical protein
MLLDVYSYVKRRLWHGRAAGAAALGQERRLE